jgi:hypothetical protein|nr:MAG TPA: hypothetical protein [Caudoviricetes sp.]
MEVSWNQLNHMTVKEVNVQLFTIINRIFLWSKTALVSKDMDRV